MILHCVRCVGNLALIVALSLSHDFPDCRFVANCRPKSWYRWYLVPIIYGFSIQSGRLSLPKLDCRKSRSDCRRQSDLTLRAGLSCAHTGAGTKIVQGWPKLWANVRALIGIFSQSVGPSLAIWANPVQFSLYVAVAWRSAGDLQSACSCSWK